MKKIVTDVNNKIYIEKGKVDKNVNPEKYFKIDENNIVSVWNGMGSAITESSGYNYSLLTKKDQKKFLEYYYDKDGLDFDLGRISIGSNDFSLDSYSYLTGKDLESFDISRDKKFIIPMLNDIYKNKKISLIASPWSPPAFMKSNHSLCFGGRLKKKYYEMYSEYITKFINIYQNMGFNIDYLTIQNEPSAIQIWESCRFSIRRSKKFINKYLGYKLGNTKILLWDHNREKLDKVVDKLYFDNSHISGVGVHWYTGGYYDKLLKVHNKYPNLLLFNTEMCCGFSKYNENEWIKDAELYIKDIIESMKSGISGYLDFNILLNFNGGPNHKHNYVKSSSILNENSDGFILTPIYYYLYHISHFIKKGYEIINVSSDNDIYVICAKNNKEVVVTILNDKDKVFSFEVNVKREKILDNIKGHSIITYII